MNFKRFIKKVKRGIEVILLKSKVSYSQAGEDIIVEYLFNSLNISHPTYLEIGTNHPKACNNTYKFYDKGCKGVCIEPDASMIEEIKKTRPNDTVLNIGIGITEQENANFYLFPKKYNGWSTFSLEEADFRKQETSISYETLSVPLKNINSIIKEYFNQHPNFISLDVEGLDLEILKSIDFDKYKPEVICVETVSFGYLNNTEKKLNNIAEFMETLGYFAYADTHINTIFCLKKLFNI